MTITPLNGTYTGQAQKLVSVSNIPDGVTITYSLDNAAYSEEIPEKQMQESTRYTTKHLEAAITTHPVQ